MLEDATSVQFGLVQVVRALEDKAYDAKTCALLLYALQTASANLKRVEQERARELREQQAEKEPMSTESFADIMIRGLGLREPDPPARPQAPAADAWPPADDSDAPFDTPSEINAPNPQSADSPAERRGPSPARRGPADDKRRATND